MAFFFIKQTSLEACFFVMRFLYLTKRSNNVRSKLKNVIKSFEMTLNSKHTTEKIKNKS